MALLPLNCKVGVVAYLAQRLALEPPTETDTAIRATQSFPPMQETACNGREVRTCLGWGSVPDLVPLVSVITFHTIIFIPTEAS